ncbi:MAG: PD-(D/E)XK nuclease domain-containing protein, partial [Bacteroidales bacterium]|nr:PD-(D/E)XK nuclease domain-containing protein [Bacteroidales bacterium]
LETSRGYTDIYMRRSHLWPDIPYEWVWEIKYIKNEDATENVLQEKREQARAQLRKYRDSHLFVGRTDIRYLSLIFIGKNRYEIEELPSAATHLI